MLVSETEVIASSYQAFSAMVGSARTSKMLNTEPKITARVREIAHRIIPHAVRYRPEIIDWQWEVHVFKNEEPNAFCMAGGKIGINSGMISLLQPTDDELAQVIAHEIAHALSEHSREKMSVAIASGLVVSSVAASQKMQRNQAAALDALATLVIMLPNSRMAESEADHIGILLAANAGYNPDAASSLWTKMLTLIGEGSTSILSTHPLPTDRIFELQKSAEKLKSAYQETALLRDRDRLPKIEYDNGIPQNIYGQGRYVLPKKTE